MKANSSKRTYGKLVKRSSVSPLAPRFLVSTKAPTASMHLKRPYFNYVRKALECMAFASMAPNKTAYEKLRLEADRQVDYRKDYNARKIILLLSKVNKDFYPIPVLPAIKQASGEWHFDRKTDGYLTKEKFESLYDRLGKFLHADNP